MTAALDRRRPSVSGDFRAFFRAHYALVWRSARRMGAPADALDDIVQDVFLVVHRSRDRFEGRSSIKTWLFGITANTVKAWHRREGRHQRRAAAVAAVAALDDHRDPTDHHATIDLLDRLLSRLGEVQRATFILVELEDVAPREVAQAHGVSINTVHSRLRLARKQLQREIKRTRAKERRLR